MITVPNFSLLCGGDSDPAVVVRCANVVGRRVDGKRGEMVAFSIACKFNNTNVMAVPVFQVRCYQLNVGI